VLVVTAAGGARQAGFSEPIGMLPIGPVTQKTVFQLLAERILALSKRYRNALRWCIFCHPGDLHAVSAFFKANGYFGLKASAVSFVAQSLLPVVDRRGKILLSGPGRIAMSPSGHGSLLLYFLDGERLEALESWGIRHIFCHQLDNPLVRVCDLDFLGAHIKHESEVSSKAVKRTSPEEPVGVFCQYNDSIGVVEYVELGEEDREARLPDGNLSFSAANIGVHLFAAEFIRRMHEEGLQLPFHAVERITPCLGRRGSVAQPKEPNSLGFKSFVFDALPMARRALVIEVPREEEFSPVKNPSGPFSPQTARSDLSRMYARWIARVRPELREAIGSGAERPVEISPLYALDSEELARKPIGEIPQEGPVLLGGGS
jgi:UDP-N-acetylglucosamine/UDP-N-acetylgalactosamine diphosphorylase